jgi:hypothetical protein
MRIGRSQSTSDTSSSLSRAGLPMTSISVILRFAIVKRSALTNRPRGATTTPMVPHVEAHAREDCGQPSAKVVDGRGIGAVESQPRFLNRVVHLADRAEHPVRYRAQVGSVLFESLGQIVAFVHRSHFLVASVITVTDERQAM